MGGHRVCDLERLLPSYGCSRLRCDPTGADKKHPLCNGYENAIEPPHGVPDVSFCTKRTTLQNLVSGGYQIPAEI